MNIPRIAPAVASAAAAAVTCVLTACSPSSAPQQPTSAPTHPRASHTTITVTASATASSPNALAGPPECANGTVGVSAQRGGALPGEELALLLFTNDSAAACSITGFPGVELFSHDTVIGKPATRTTQAVRTLTVAPGAHVTAVLHDDTRCNADLSDKVGVYVPNQTAQERVPLELRACALTIDPVRRSN
jgi:hypothetical protein